MIMTTIKFLLADFEEYMRDERRFAGSTVTAYLSDLNDLAQHITGDVESADLAKLRAYQRTLSQRGLSVATVQRKFAAFMTFWRWLRIEGYAIDVLPERIDLPDLPVYVPRWLSEAELRRFVDRPVKKRGVAAWTGQRDQLAWKTMAWLGLRRSEIMNMRVADVLLSDGVIIVRGIKNRRDRVMPLPEAIAGEMKAMISERPGTDFVFPGANGGRWLVASFNRCFRTHLKACELAGIGITPHSLRHTFATHLIRAGVHLIDVKDLLGHVDVKSTMRYVHNDASRLVRVMQQYILNEEQR